MKFITDKNGNIEPSVIYVGALLGLSFLFNLVFNAFYLTYNMLVVLMIFFSVLIGLFLLGMVFFHLTLRSRFKDQIHPFYGKECRKCEQTLGFWNDLVRSYPVAGASITKCRHCQTINTSQDEKPLYLFSEAETEAKKEQTL